MQSHSNELYLLPAVPKDLKDGNINGLRARGGYGVNISWANQQLKEATITSKFAQTCNLRSKTPVKILLNKQVIKLTKAADNLYTFNVEAGKTYTVLPN
ncbi:glycoside hydrolase family 95-like protein [Pedobacter aquae]